jgi:hypothetical protein
MIVSKLIDIESDLINTKSSVSLHNTTNPIIEEGDVVVSYAKVESNNLEWRELPTNVIGNIGLNGMVMLDLNSVEFKESGKYIISIRPRKFSINIIEVVNNIMYANSFEENLDGLEDPNYFYGWNLQLINPQNGLKIGSQKIISGSLWGADLYKIKVDEDIPELRDNIRAEIWSNLFVPVVIDLDIVEHNNLTLSYSLYGRKEMNTSTGLATIYDHTGNVYKQFSYGTYSNDATGGAIVEYKLPAPIDGE